LSRILLERRIFILFYERLKNLCAERGISPSALVLSAGMSKGNVTGWQNGQSPSLDTVYKLAEKLKVSPYELIPDMPVHEEDSAGKEENTPCQS
jgi:transcriptional regulator with XRE-family HTH domain